MAEPSSESSSEIITAIAELAREKLDYSGPLTPEMRLVEDLELDSIRLLTLATAVEDHFRICLEEDDEASIETVADLVAVVERELEQGQVSDAG